MSISRCGGRIRMLTRGRKSDTDALVLVNGHGNHGTIDSNAPSCPGGGAGVGSSLGIVAPPRQVFSCRKASLCAHPPVVLVGGRRGEVVHRLQPDLGTAAQPPFTTKGGHAATHRLELGASGAPQ